MDERRFGMVRRYQADPVVNVLNGRSSVNDQRARHRMAALLLVVAAVAAGAGLAFRPRGLLGPILGMTPRGCALAAPLAGVTTRRWNRGLAIAWAALALLVIGTSRGREGFSAIVAVFAFCSGALAWARERGGWGVSVVGVVLVVVGGPAAWALGEAAWACTPHLPPLPEDEWGPPGPFAGEGGLVYAAVFWIAASILILFQTVAAASLPLLPPPQDRKTP